MEHGNVLFRVLCILTVLYFDVIAPDYDVLTHLILRTLSGSCDLGGFGRVSVVSPAPLSWHGRAGLMF